VLLKDETENADSRPKGASDEQLRSRAGAKGPPPNTLAFYKIMQSIIVILVAGLLAVSTYAEETVQFTKSEAKGDARMIAVTTELNSPVVRLVSKDTISNADLGKAIMLDGAGSTTAGTNHQDYLGKVIEVPDERHLTLSKPLGVTATNVHGIYGTDNAPAFQKYVDRAFGSNTVIMIPPGNYLMIPPDLYDPEYRMSQNSEIRAAVVIQKGGITFKGGNSKTTILTACGTWQLKGKYVSRGMLFECRGPIRHAEYPLVFENITFDGGVHQGRQDYRGFPARTTDGTGWDMTHGAVIDRGVQPLHAFKAFRNCVFQHWRGEILKGTSGATNGFIEITGCGFHDGNASAFNFSLSHHINYCTFSKLNMAMEFYEGYMVYPSVFENSSVSDVRADLVIVGALTNHPAPLYTIRNNDFQADQFGIFVNPAKNILIESNRFEGQGFCIGNGAGAQGTDYCHDIIIRANVCTNAGALFLVQCGYNNRMEKVLITGNSISGRGCLGGGWGYSTNITFSNNISTNGARGIDGTRLTGEWFFDDLSNYYRPHQVCNDSGITNLISYGNGARQEVLPGKTNSIFLIDDSHPEKIPSGANLLITHQGTRSAPLYLSTSHPAQKPDVMLNPSNTITCTWTNGGWRLDK